MEGKIKSLVLDRGYGFVRLSNGRDAFFHVTDLDKAVAWDEQLLHRRVEFDIEIRDEKERAVNVRLVNQ